MRLWVTVFFIIKVALLLISFYFTSEKVLLSFVYKLSNVTYPVQASLFTSIPHYEPIHITVFIVFLLMIVFDYCKTVMFAEIAEDIAAIRDDVESIRRYK